MGDDPTTEVMDGLQEGEAFCLKLWDADKDTEMNVKISKIDMGHGLVYETDGLTVVEIDVSKVTPSDFEITSAYPNPFNSSLKVNYGLAKAGEVSLNVYDIAGRLVVQMVNGWMDAGNHSAILDGSELPSGVYLLRLKSGTDVSQLEIALVK